MAGCLSLYLSVCLSVCLYLSMEAREPVGERRETNGAAECSGAKTTRGKIVAIDMPAHVTNVDQALELLGGIRAISQVLCSSGASTSNSQSPQRKLTLRFDPSDKAFRPLEAKRRATDVSLFKVVTGGEGRKWAERLGQVTEAYSFTSLADFYHPCSDASVEDVDSVAEGLNVILEDPASGEFETSGVVNTKDGLNIIPPFFSRVGAPVDLMKGALAVSSKKDMKKKNKNKKQLGTDNLKQKKKIMSSAKIKRVVNALLKTNNKSTVNSERMQTDDTPPTPPPKNIVSQAEEELEAVCAKPDKG